MLMVEQEKCLPNIVTMDADAFEHLINEKMEPLKNEINALKSQIRIIIEDHTEEAEYLLREIAEDRQRLAVLEGQPKNQVPTDAMNEQVNRLYTYILESGLKGITYSQAAKALHLTKARICQLRTCIADDERFILGKHPTKSNTNVICLRRK